MNITIHPRKLKGSIQAIPSKSMLHRLLICAAFARGSTTLLCSQTCEDVDATVSCLQNLGAIIHRDESKYTIIPVSKFPDHVILNCRESGSTLRFLLPVVGALGISATFIMEGRLPQRPLSPLWEEMERMGCKLRWESECALSCQGKLLAGDYSIKGTVSSQFISGLLLGMYLMDGPSSLQIIGNTESEPYIQMTKAVIEQFGPSRTSPGIIAVEGDWSNSAFFFAANALGSNISIFGLNEFTLQGDRMILHLLPVLANFSTISASDIPDLIPVLAVVAAANSGAIFTNIRRLRLKESNRVKSIINLIESLGGKAECTEDTLFVSGDGLHGGTVDCCNDHRIAMAAAIAATVCKSNVIIRGAECVNKSYPRFWEDYTSLGGIYEQHLRK